MLSPVKTPDAFHPSILIALASSAPQAVAEFKALERVFAPQKPLFGNAFEVCSSMGRDALTLKFSFGARGDSVVRLAAADGGNLVLVDCSPDTSSFPVSIFGSRITGLRGVQIQGPHTDSGRRYQAGTCTGHPPSREQATTLTSLFNRLRGFDLQLNTVGLELPNTISAQAWQDGIARLASSACVYEYPDGMGEYVSGRDMQLFVVPARAEEIASHAALMEADKRYPLFGVACAAHSDPVLKLDLWVNGSSSRDIKARFPESFVVKGLEEVARSVYVDTKFRKLERWRVDLRFGSPEVDLVVGQDLATLVADGRPVTPDTVPPLPRVR